MKFFVESECDMTKQGSDFGYCVTFTKRTTFMVSSINQINQYYIFYKF
jgi:hypothetical protein